MLTRLLLLLTALAVLATGCAGSPGPTPTPTRTPQAAGSPTAPAVEASPTGAEPGGPTAPPATRGPDVPAGGPTLDPNCEGMNIVPETTPAPRPTTVFRGRWPQLASPEYGIQAFLWWRPEVADRDLNFVREMGFTWVKQGIGWRDVELARGEYDWCRADRIVAQANAKALNLLVRLDHTPEWAARPGDQGAQTRPADFADFAGFCETVSARYAGRVRAYQVWNEPNLDREWGMASPDPAEYVELLKACYEGIKRGDPEAIVISAGLAPTGTDTPQVIPDIKFVEGIYAAGGADYFDMLGFNAPGYAAPPEMSPDEAEAQYNGRWFCFRHVEDVRAVMVANGDEDKQIAVLELGWTTDPIHPDYSWFAVDEATQADYLVRSYEYARENWQPWIGLMSMIYIADPDWTEEHEQYWWAVTLPSYPETSVRPAYEALQAMPK
jgi:hypothetical protein